MNCLRCSFCSLDFPGDRTKYKVCPVCDQETTMFSNIRPMPEAEAESILNHSAFELFYANWESKKASEC